MPKLTISSEKVCFLIVKAREFDVQDYDLHCPECGQATSLCVSGDELELAYLEVEEHEPSTA